MTNYEKAAGSRTDPVSGAPCHIRTTAERSIHALLAVVDELRALREWLAASYPTFYVQLNPERRVGPPPDVPSVPAGIFYPAGSYPNTGGSGSEPPEPPPTFSVQRVSGSTPKPREWLGVADPETTDGLSHDAP